MLQSTTASWIAHLRLAEEGRNIDIPLIDCLELTVKIVVVGRGG